MPSMRMPLPTVRSATLAHEEPRGLWILAGQCSLYLVLIKGYGTIDDALLGFRLKPVPYFALVLLTCTTTVLLSPRGRVLRIAFPAFATLYCTWWLASWAWSEFPPAFRPATFEEFGTVLGMAVLVGVLPRDVFVKTLVNSYYVVVGIIALATVAQPSKSMNNISEDGRLAVAGWHGAFLHKNHMTPALIFGTILVLLYDHRSSRRLVVGSVTGVLILLGQSGTGLGAYIGVLATYWWINRFVKKNQRMGIAFIFSTFILMVAMVWVGLSLLPQVLELYGKDTSFSGRTTIWNGSIEAIRLHPWRGWGYGGVWWAAGLEPTKSINAPLGFYVTHAHNAVLEMLLRLGFVGLGLFLATFFGTIVACARLIRTDPLVGKGGVLLAVLIAMFGVSEVTVFGIWFAFLLMFRVMANRSSGSGNRRFDPTVLLRRSAPPTGAIYTRPQPIRSR